MGLQFVCQACGRHLTVPEELYANKIRGRVVTVKCKGCGAPVGIDGTLPPPPAEAASQPKVAVAAEQDSSSNVQVVSQPNVVVAAEQAAGSKPTDNKPARDKGTIRKPEQERAVSNKLDRDKGIIRKPEQERAAFNKLRFRKAQAGKSEQASSVPSDLAPGKLAASKPSAKTATRDEPAIDTAAIEELMREHAAPDEPGQDSFEVDAAWGALPADDDDDSSRFSHVDGPIPVRLPSARIGRYSLFDQFAEGGIATVHFGRIDGAGGFSRVVAIKRLLPHLVENEEFTEMLLKEARLAARVRHPNVVPTLDVVASKGDVLLVLEYVHGESLSALCRTQAKERKDHVPVDIGVAVMHDVLSGLCAVHEATDEKGRLLGLVHRDISPPNVVVGADGYSRVLDFGIAKALEHIEESMPNRLKGKIGYMSPEQIRGEGVTQRSDVFSAGVILWELLATRRLFSSSIESERMKEIVGGNYPLLSRYRPGIGRQLEQATMRALAVDPEKRFANSREFADALELASTRASARRVAAWVTDLAAKTLSDRARMIAQVENWNAGPEIPLNSNPFVADTHLSDSGVLADATPVLPLITTKPASQRPSRARSLAVAESRSVNAPWLLLVSCLILFVALCYTIWR